ncbi:uncharacterized protein LOC117902803 [Drosophila subobscura]|uniref:uncharacterized protein LOC117902803 n=1 Tax=Drosophila subobscura TaxID=7241 RepID=UPI00155A8B89|nr:uncharacterized protein LOC117902803 [Drosophila subobscura]
MRSHQQQRDKTIAEFAASLNLDRRGQLPSASRELNECTNTMMNRQRRTVGPFTLPPLVRPPPPRHIFHPMHLQGAGDRMHFNLQNILPAIPRAQLAARIGGGDGELPGQGLGQAGVHQLNHNEVAPPDGGFWLRPRAARHMNIAFRVVRGGLGRGEALRAMAVLGQGQAGDGPYIVGNGAQVPPQMRRQIGAGDGPARQQIADVMDVLFGNPVRRPRHRHIFNSFRLLLRYVNRRRFALRELRGQILQAAAGPANRDGHNVHAGRVPAEVAVDQEPVLPEPHGLNANEDAAEIVRDVDGNEDLEAPEEQEEVEPPVNGNANEIVGLEDTQQPMAGEGSAAVALDPLHSVMFQVQERLGHIAEQMDSYEKMLPNEQQHQDGDGDAV